MNLTLTATLVVLIINVIILLLVLRKLTQLSLKDVDPTPILNGISAIQRSQEQIDRSVRDEISRNRQENAQQLQGLRSEVLTTLTGMGDSVAIKVEALNRSTEQKLELLRSGMEQRLDLFTAESSRKIDALTQSVTTASVRLQDEVSAKLGEFKTSLEGNVKETYQLQRQQTDSISAVIQVLQTSVEGRLTVIQTENEKKLEQMRQTVDEKLQGTLEARLGESFKQVSDRLEQVYKGLGEMQTLAAGVGDLKKVLTNVKTRGTWGEVQLGALLEQMLAPGQYAQNVATTGTSERVEYAIKLPGRAGDGTPVWLPIDAKFPVEDYQRLVEASERGDAEAADKASRQLDLAIRLSAKSLSTKYIAPPATTDFGILFLSTEGLYAEAMRRSELAESVQREHRIVLAGPSTLAALLNSFQMGFRTLAIQQRSSEVWELLGTVKSEFGKYADVLGKVKKKLQEANNTIETAETRTRAIHRKLRDVESTNDEGFSALDAPETDPDESKLLEV